MNRDERAPADSGGDSPRSRDLLNVPDGPWMASRWVIMEFAGRVALTLGEIPCSVDGCAHLSCHSAEGFNLCYGHSWRWRRARFPDLSTWIVIPQAPIRDHADSRSRRPVEFDEMHPDIAHEIRFVFAHKLRDGDWTPNASLRRALESLRDSAAMLDAQSFRERTPDQWMLTCREVALKGTINKTWDRNVAPYIRSFFTALTRALVADPWASDVWHWKDQFERILGGTRYETTVHIDWSNISQTWLREPLKALARQELQTGRRKWNTLVDWARGFGAFSAFLRGRAVLQPSQITRAIFIEHLNDVRSRKSKTARARVNQVASVLATLKFEELVPDLGADVYLRRGENAIPKVKSPRPWPTDILQRIDDELLTDDEEDEQLILMLRFCRWSGPRVSELAALPIDSLVDNGKGDYWIEYWTPKVSRYRRFPLLDPLLGTALVAQVQKVRSRYGEDAQYMFPQPRQSSRSYNVARPWSPGSIGEAFERLFLKHAIVESKVTGETVSGADVHRFRHTIGTQLLNAGWTQQQVQEFLGHESPTMVSAYAKILDETLNKKADEFHRLVQAERAAQGRAYTDPVVERLRAVSSAVTPLGSCGLPATQRCSARENPCLTCSFFTPGTGAQAEARLAYRDLLVKKIEKAQAEGHTKIEEINRGILANLDAVPDVDE